MESRRRMMMSAVGGGKRDNNIIFYLDSVLDFMDGKIYRYNVSAEYPVSSDIAVWVNYYSLDDDGFLVPADLRYVIRTGKTQGAASDGIAGVGLPIREITDMIIIPKEDSKYRYIANGNW